MGEKNILILTLQFHLPSLNLLEHTFVLCLGALSFLLPSSNKCCHSFPNSILGHGHHIYAKLVVALISLE
jgi:hypothetical protein